MKLAVITLPDIMPGEADLINDKFLGGDRRFPDGPYVLHLRKPGASVSELRSLLDGIRPEFYGRIVLHDAFDLCGEYGLRGVHLNSRNPVAPVGVGHVSRSCHSLDEVRESLSSACPYAYVFLSPVFDSISKAGYSSAFSDGVLRQAAMDGIINNRVFALGGVDFSNLEYLESVGFGGAAMLGAAWRK